MQKTNGRINRPNQMLAKIIGVFLIAVALLFPAYAEEKFTSETLGIYINPPATKAGLECPVYPIATFYLPGKFGFSANVTIMKQRYNQSMDNYDKLSLSQFKSLNAKVLMHKLKDDEALYEYLMEQSGKKLHFYVRAVKQGKNVYCITATALNSNWEEQKAELIKSVNSFEVRQ